MYNLDGITKPELERLAVDKKVFELEQLAGDYHKASVEIERLTADKKVLGMEIIERLKAENMDGRVVGKYAVSIIRKEICNTTIEDAAQFGAVITEEKVNTAILRKIKKSGMDVPGFNIREEVRVKLGAADG